VSVFPGAIRSRRVREVASMSWMRGVKKKNWRPRSEKKKYPVGRKKKKILERKKKSGPWMLCERRREANCPPSLKREIKNQGKPERWRSNERKKVTAPNFVAIAKSWKREEQSWGKKKEKKIVGVNRAPGDLSRDGRDSSQSSGERGEKSTKPLQGKRRDLGGGGDEKKKIVALILAETNKKKMSQ